MGRIRVFASLALLLTAAFSFAVDHRLVVASDDPAVRNVPTYVIYEPTGKLKKTDRITSITFSAAADVKPNCLVSLDPSGGKFTIPLGPDVQVFKGKVLVSGSKPSRKVIPGYLSVDKPLPVAPPESAGVAAMRPIIQQVNNLPWLYIGGALVLFMGVMFVMNRRSQQFTSTMSKEAKSVYVETISRITDRLEKIEANQERLVKNPPVIRSFRNQISDFELRLGRIEKVAIEGKEELVKASAELAQAALRDSGLSTKFDASLAQGKDLQTKINQESAGLLAELKLLAKAHSEAYARLAQLEGIQSGLKQSLERGARMESQLTAQESRMAVEHNDRTKRWQALDDKLADLKERNGQLQSLPLELKAVSAKLSALPPHIETIKASIPNLESIEAKLDLIAAFDARLAKLDELSVKLDMLPEIQSGLADLPTHFPKLDENLARSQDFERLATQLNALSEIQSSLDALPSHISKLDDGLAKAHDLAKLSAQLDTLSEMKSTLDALPSHFSKLDDSLVKSQDLDKLAGQLEALNEIKTSLDSLPSHFPKLDDGLVKSQDFEKLSAQLDALNEIKSSLEALPSQLPKIEEGNGKSADLEKISAQLEALGDIKSRLDALPSQLPNFGGDLAEIHNSLQKQIEGLTGRIDESGANIADLIVSTSQVEESDEDVEPKKSRKKSKQIAAPQEEEIAEEAAESAPPAPAAKKPEAEGIREVAYRYPEDVEAQKNGEFSFSNAIRQMAEEEVEVKAVEKPEVKPTKASPGFKLEDLPDKLETFEDSGPDVVLPTLKVETTKSNPLEEERAVEMVLHHLTAKKSATPKPAKAAPPAEEDGAAHMGHWNGYAGSSARTWSSQSSRPLELVQFEGELKPLTPIETAPIADRIGAIIYGFGRVLYSCGNRVNGFWPGREGRSVAMDHAIPPDDWRLAVKGQNLFVAETKRVKIASIQGWFVLEQFSGEYHDQLLTEGRWMGLRHEKGSAVIDFRDLRGQMCSEGVNLNMSPDGVQLCAGGDQLFAGSSAGRIVSVAEHGLQEIHGCPPGAELVHLAYADGAPMGLYRINGSLHVYHFGKELKTANLSLSAFAGKPVILGNKLYLADLDEQKLISADLKTMEIQSVPAFQGVSLLRRLVGVQHRGQHNLVAITSDTGKKGGRLLCIDPKNGWEMSFGPVGPADVNLICADHHLVFATSNQYQNVIRVLEPFVRMSAAA